MDPWALLNHKSFKAPPPELHVSYRAPSVEGGSPLAGHFSDARTKHLLTRAQNSKFHLPYVPRLSWKSLQMSREKRSREMLLGEKARVSSTGQGKVGESSGTAVWKGPYQSLAGSGPASYPPVHTHLPPFHKAQHHQTNTVHLQGMRIHWGAQRPPEGRRRKQSELISARKPTP